MSISSIIGAIKSVASFITLLIHQLEKYRDDMLETRVEKEKNQRAQIVAQIKKASEEGKSDEEIAKLHRRLSDFDAD